MECGDEDDDCWDDLDECWEDLIKCEEELFDWECWEECADDCSYGCEICEDGGWGFDEYDEEWEEYFEDYECEEECWEDSECLADCEDDCSDTECEEDCEWECYECEEVCDFCDGKSEASDNEMSNERYLECADKKIEDFLGDYEDKDGEQYLEDLKACYEMLEEDGIDKDIEKDSDCQDLWNMWPPMCEQEAWDEDYWKAHWDCSSNIVDILEDYKDECYGVISVFDAELDCLAEYNYDNEDA